MSSTMLKLSNNLLDYLVEHSLRDDDILARLREETSRLTMARMQISPIQGQLMGLLAQLVGAKIAVEVGTFTGYSALCVARALPSDGKLIACDVSEEWTAIGKSYWEEAHVAERIDLRIAPAVETLDNLIDSGLAGQVDFGFIDADKPSYDHYYERLLTLLRPGGIILVDNVLWGGAVIDDSDQSEDTQAIRKLNAKVVKDPRVDVSMLPIGDGLTLVRKR